MSHEPITADSLTSLALHGSREAWASLVLRHGHAVVVSLVARGLSVDRAKDLAQAAWTRLVEQQRAGRLESLSLPGLAIAQARFLAQEEARMPGEGNVALDTAPEIADGASDPEVRALGKEQLERAKRELDGCARSAREVFQLAYGGDGLSHAEVAKKSGLSLQRVRQILCEVRKKLRESIEEPDHG
jgi:RNA polymerase sigma-70 factor (ECF subfamily)